MKKKIVMLKRIVGLKGSHNSLIILKKEKEIGLVKKNCRLRIIKKKTSCSEEKEDKKYVCWSTIEKMNNMWFVDIGYTNHMFCNKDIFLDMNITINS